MTASFFSGILGAGIGALIAQFVGAAIRGKVARSRFLEICRDADLEAMENAVDELKKTCLSYWSKDAKSLGIKDKLLSTKILGLITLINGCIENLYEDDCYLKDAAKADFRYVYRPITDNGFSDSDRKKNFGVLAKVETWSATFKINSRRMRRKLKRHWLAD